MRRTGLFALVPMLTVLSLALSLAAGRPAQISQAPVAPPRDPVPPTGRGAGGLSQPTERRIPIGAAVVTGTVTSAETGRPIRGARVSLSGIIVPPGARVGGTPGAVSGTGSIVTSGGVSIAVPGGIAAPSGGASFGRGGGPIQIAAGVVGMSSVSRMVLTDEQGRFSFPKLPAGQYTLMASQNQYLMTNYGQKKPGGPGSRFQLTDGQQMKASLPMLRGGVITGLVIGEDGEPQPNARVSAWRYMMTNGVRRLQQNAGGTTDDRGAYRLYNLQPGDYIVAATPPSDYAMSDRMMADMQAIEQAIASGAVQPPAAPGLPATVSIPIQPPGQPQTMADTPPPSYLPVYHPGTPIPGSAAVIHVSGGDEHPSVDIPVRLVQASTVQGTIANPLGPEVAIQVSLQTDDPMLSGSMNTTRVDQNGKFTFRTVAPGKYTLVAQTVPGTRMTLVNGVQVQPTPGPPPQLEDSQKWWARAVITVEGQSTVNVSPPLQPGRSISGVVLFDMARPPDLTRARISVTLTSAPSQQQISFGPLPQAPIGPDGRFTLNGIVPGKYILRGGGGILKSAIVNGDDTLDFPLDFTGERDISDAVLTVTDPEKVSEISGTLSDAAGKAALDYTIIAATADTRFWTPGSRRIALARPGPDGRYIFRNLPTGDYLLAAVSELENGGQYDPEFLKSLTGAAAMRISVVEGVKVTQDLRVAK